MVIYTADHGLAMGSHGLLGKQSLYEHSMRSPLVIAGPGIPAGRSTEAFTYLFDLVPTICALAGVTPPEKVAGEDLRPLWEGKGARVRDSVFLPFSDLMVTTAKPIFSPAARCATALEADRVSSDRPPPAVRPGRRPG